MRQIMISLLAVASFSAFDMASAQDSGPAPFPEFSPRRITVPTPGQSGPRINIQIGDQTTQDAASQPRVTASPAPSAPVSTTNWFWSEINPGRDFGAGRYEAALNLLSSAPEAAQLPIPRAAELHAMAEAYDTTILQATIGTRVSPAFALAVIAVESRGDVNAQSGAGAQGLMQLIPATAERFGVEDSFDAAQNIAGGVAYLDWLMDQFDRDPVLVLAGYNAGEGAVREAHGVPDYVETRDYIPRVLATFQLARLLCLTPPELISDGCVFQSMMGGAG